jgi:lipopolysaccharide export system permease protein
VKRVDSLIYRELVGPWVFGVAIFSALIFATVLLVRVTDWVVRGVSPNTITEVIFLLLPGIVVKTFAMSSLLSALLAFGRLSNDSEVVALRAAGASLLRIMRPVIFFSLGVAALAFGLNETVVPGAAERATALTTEIKKQMDATKGARPASYTKMGKNGVEAQIAAQDFSLVEQTLTGVVLVSYNSEGKLKGKPAWILVADQFRYFGPKDWRLIGPADLFSANGETIVHIKDGAWPTQVPPPEFTPENLLAGFADDLDVFSMRQIKGEIERLKRDPSANVRQIANLEFGFYNKVALPLGSLIFALLGAPLGIRNARAGVGTGFALSVVLSFAYLMIANFMAVYAKGGAIPPWVASFTPLLIGAAAAALTIYKRNV